MSTDILLEITQNNLKSLFTTNNNVITGEDYKKKYGIEGIKYNGLKINTSIIINKDQTLKDFDNVKTVASKYIQNSGIIENCVITLNNASEIDNGYYFEGNINNCIITLNSESLINNGNDFKGNINNCTIVLNNESLIYNGYDYEGSINKCTITLNNKSYIDNGYVSKSNINNCTINLNNESSIYNNNKSEILNSHIVIHNNSSLWNFDIVSGYGTLINNYIHAYENCQIKNSNKNGSGIFNSNILKFSDSCQIDESIEKDKIKDGNNYHI